jgi:hypothetical protein
MRIQTNEAGCGRGKTQYNLKLIRNLVNDRFLVIVPSIKLANEYGLQLNIEPITSEFASNVQQAISRQVELGNRIIVVTQKAFKDYKLKRDLCFRRHVIQDEELAVLTINQWKMDNHREYLDMFSIRKLTENWYSVDIDLVRASDFIKSEDIFDDKTFLHDLLNNPQMIVTNRPTIEDDSLIISILSPEIYSGCQSLLIASANFSQTQQRHLWQQLFNVEFEQRVAFEPYPAENVTIHYAEQMRNSKTYNSKRNDIRDEFIKYVGAHARDPIYIDNNNQPDIPGWTRLTHNCHGENQYRTRAHIAVLSAINYPPTVINFFTEVIGMTPTQLRLAMFGEIAHQVIMRGCLRVDIKSRCDIYLMEQEIAMYIYSLFEQAKIKSIENTARKTRRLSRSVINKASAIRMNHPEVKKLTTEQLMKHEIWQQTNAKGRFTRKAIQEMQLKLSLLNDKG